ncbi:ABC transporter ATP-binding protein [Wukongibacter baidiensis]|uniref:ABC transporter ATP-binding protein n=1 Tax=Wukongibacter baidiensis TaxID=1723361 RepID=UPI003D7FD5E3
MSFIETQDLCKIYGKDETEVDALKNVSIKIDKGEFVAITGPSGSGKSTLLHMLGAVDKPTSGKVIIDGIDVFNAKERELAIFRRRKIGFVFQFYNLIPVLNAEENITIPIKLDGRDVEKEYLEEIIETLGLGDRRKHFPNQLSGGQQQRIAIGRALINRPAIILADEPTGSLDTKNSREIISLLKLAVKKYGQTLILITHDPSIAAQADRTIFMEDGKVRGDDR